MINQINTVAKFAKINKRLNSNNDLIQIFEQKINDKIKKEVMSNESILFRS